MASNQHLQLPYPPPRANHLRLTIRHLYTDRWIVLEVPETMRIGEVKLQALQRLLPCGIPSVSRESAQRETLQVAVATQRKQASSAVTSASTHSATSHSHAAKNTIRTPTGPPEHASFPAQEPSSPFALGGGFSEVFRTPASSAQSSMPAGSPKQSLFDESSSSAHEVFPDSTSSFSTGSQISLPRTAEEEECNRPHSPPQMPYETEAFQGTSLPPSGRRSSVAVAAMLARGDGRGGPTAKLSGAVKALPSKVTRSRSRTVPQKDQSDLFGFSGRMIKREEEIFGFSGRMIKREEEMWSFEQHRLVSAVLGCHSDDAAMVGRKLKQYDVLTLLPGGVQFDPPLSQYPQAFLFIENVLVSKSPVDTIPGLRLLMSESSKWKWSSRSLMVCEGQLQLSKGSVTEFTGSLPALAVKSQEIAPLGSRKFIVALRFGDGRSLILSPTSYADYVNLMRVTGEDGNEFLEPSDSLEYRFNAINLAYASHHGGLNTNSSPARSISIGGSTSSESNRSQRRSTKPEALNLPPSITPHFSTDAFFRFPTFGQPRTASGSSPKDLSGPCETNDSDPKERTRCQTLPLPRGKEDDFDRLRSILSSTTKSPLTSGLISTTPSPPLRSESERERERTFNDATSSSKSSSLSPLRTVGGGGVELERSFSTRRHHQSSCSIDSAVERSVMTSHSHEAAVSVPVDRRTPLANEWIALKKETTQGKDAVRGGEPIQQGSTMLKASKSTSSSRGTDSQPSASPIHENPVSSSYDDDDDDDDDQEDEQFLAQAMRKKSIIFDRNEEIRRQQILSSRLGKSQTLVARRPTTARSNLGPMMGGVGGGVLTKLNFESRRPSLPR
ncbi:BZ3500_MvSof-1268-A1-R1_Chr8-2g10260 [Microbotryum saponariae]|uniref:BZ3500_MvSof-1268-A1-R1_Chr8-2g10260 protein n=1 Tax=Microbotryum saponariae TaxID=289078 RepID=A0A2X0LC38_9BASI|nr:BZ3500_MvSof-1268-A1-R1_Chr8-2g10260 [Microbotryum saponariae]SDA02058.1 BZ3501_MvSof-1269-A2-R1_Chr8-2g10010 [Microbotryum saponariae]